MLSPRINADEPFTMTLEMQGQSFAFEGHLVNSELTMERESFESDPFNPTLYYSGVRRFTVNLEISARNMVRNVL